MHLDHKRTWKHRIRSMIKQNKNTRNPLADEQEIEVLNFFLSFYFKKVILYKAVMKPSIWIYATT